MLEVSLGACGLVIYGVVRLLRLIRDWKADKRAADLRADQEEAVRDHEQARVALLVERVRILRLYRKHAENGVWLVPPTELLQAVSHDQPDGLEMRGLGDVSPDLSPGLELPAGPSLDHPPLEEIRS